MIETGIKVDGVRQVVRNIRRMRAQERRARASAIGKVSASARGKIRRQIVAEEGIPLKLTRKRVQWFWKKKGRLGEEAETKIWVGTGVPITARELPRLEREEGRDRRVSLVDTANRLVRKIVEQTVAREYPRLLRSQLRRFGL